MASLTKEKKIAHAKQREEIRNAVHLALTDKGLSKQNITQGITDLINKIVNEQVTKAVNRATIKMDGIVETELTKQLRGIVNSTTVQTAVKKALATKVDEFVDSTIKIKVVEKDIW